MCARQGKQMVQPELLIRPATNSGDVHRCRYIKFNSTWLHVPKSMNHVPGKQTRLTCFLPNIRYTGHITPNPVFNSLARSSVSNSCPFVLPPSFVTPPFSFNTLASSTHRLQTHSPKPHASNSRLRARTPISGFTYVTKSSSPGLIARLARSVMRASAVRCSRCRTETFGIQEWLRCECRVYRPP